jgi:hypothetical protein
MRDLIPSRAIFPQVISLRSMRRAKRNGPKATRRHGKQPCVALTQVTFLSHHHSSLHHATELSAEPPQITKSIVNHIQTSLARAPYNIDDFGAYQAAALAVRDDLIVSYDLLGCLKTAAAYLLCSSYAIITVFPPAHFSPTSTF